MKTLFKLAFLLFLGILIFGGAAITTYNLYLKPHKVSSRKRDRLLVAPPDFSSSEFATLQARLPSLPLAERKFAVEKFVAAFPASPQAVEGRRMLGQWNIEAFFSPENSTDSTTYVVRPGDSLTRIANHNNVSFDLLIRANNLDRLLIHPGDKFLIPRGDFSLEISKDGKSVTLQNHGNFFKNYPALQSRPPASGWRADGLQVSEKIAWHDGQRVAFGDKNYLGSSRWISLSQLGVALYSNVEDGSPPDVEKPAAGLQFSVEDLEELFALVNRGTPVTIAP